MEAVHHKVYKIVGMQAMALPVHPKVAANVHELAASGLNEVITTCTRGKK